MVRIEREKCTGCLICQEVCPFEAVNIIPRTDGLPYQKEVVIMANQCAECGFCVTVCEPSATSMMGETKSSFQEHIENLLSMNGGKEKHDKAETKPDAIAFICERSLDFESFLSRSGRQLASHNNVAAMIIPCIGIISPSIIDYSLEAGAERIFVIGCRALDCHYREARRRIKFGDYANSSQHIVEKMDNPNIKIFLISRFEVAKLVHDIDMFLGE